MRESQPAENNSNYTAQKRHNNKSTTYLYPYFKYSIKKFNLTKKVLIGVMQSNAKKQCRNEKEKKPTYKLY